MHATIHKQRHRAIDRIQAQLSLLRALYGPKLRHESIRESICRLEQWLQDYHRGDRIAGEHLYLHGQEMLEHVSLQLQSANENIVGSFAPIPRKAVLH